MYGEWKLKEQSTAIVEPPEIYDADDIQIVEEDKQVSFETGREVVHHFNPSTPANPNPLQTPSTPHLSEPGPPRLPPPLHSPPGLPGTPVHQEMHHFAQQPSIEPPIWDHVMTHSCTMQLRIEVTTRIK